MHKLFFALLLTALLFSCSGNDNGTSNPPPGPNEVTIGDNFFNPSNLTVAVGTTVTWRQNGSNQHTVTSGAPGAMTNLFNSNNLSNGQTFTFTFMQTGTVHYFCRIHGAPMSGTITVQ